MGYSSRYHAASLAAVLVALAVGILIGAALGSDVITGTAENLEEDLGEDLDRLRAENADLEADLEVERSFERQIYPTVVAGRLEGREVALVALGEVDTAAVTGAVEEALGPAGATLGQVAEVAEPPDAAALIEALRPSARRALPRGEALELAARKAGEGLLSGEDLGDAREALFSGFSGEPAGIDAAIIVRAGTDGLEPRDEADTERLEDGLLEGMARTGKRVVGAERTDDDPSQIEFFTDRGLASVDNLDTVAGQVALVLALDGAQGAFGTKETAEGLLPDLVTAEAQTAAQAP
jgi:hypothetical protein